MSLYSKVEDDPVSTMPAVFVPDVGANVIPELEALLRIERKLDHLIAALADEDDLPTITLEGEPAGQERDSTKPL